MAQSGYIIYTTRAEKYLDGALEMTGAVQANTEFLADGTIPDPNYVPKVLNIGTCPIDPPPLPPTNLVASSIENFGFTLSWDSSTGATGYKIYRDYVLYQDVGNILTKVIVGQTPGAGAAWTVTAYNVNAESDHSNSIVVNQPLLSAVDMSNVSYQDDITACSSGPTANTINLFHTGNGVYPEINDDIYIDNIGSSTFDGNVEWWYDKNGNRSYEINGSGKVLDVINC